MLLALAIPVEGLLAQSFNYSESFTGTTADGWVFGGNYTPNLTANGGGDAVGNGWLRLTDNAGNRSTYALLDTEIFSVNAKIEITMEYTFWNGTGGGADGITFFLVDAASSFSPGAFGGSLGYAQKDAVAAPPSGVSGMAGGYLGFGFDNFGNYSNPTEGRIGGVGSRPNAIAVRGPESSGWAYIDGATLGSQMDFPDSTTRPDQTGAAYRAFKIILDANNQLEVLMKFGASGIFQSVFTADLSGYERPETFKIGFTGATGGSTEIHEVRNVELVSTPWSTGSGAYEWDNGAGTTTWGNTPGGNNSNWFSDISGNNNKTPLAKSDVLFGNKPDNNPGNHQQVTLGSNVEVRNMTFDSGINYSIGTQGDGRTITFGKNASNAGLPSINVNDYNGAYARHKINSNISLAEDIAIRNYSYSTLCLNGTFATNGKTITTSGYGATNFNGQITGSGDLIVKGSSTANPAAGQGIVTISGANTTWSGDITVNGGQLVVLHDNALGLTGDAFNRNTNAARSSGATTLQISNSGAIPVIGQEVTGSSSIPAGTVITAVTASGSNYILTLSNALTGSISSNTSLNYAYGNTTVNSGGTLTFRGGVTSPEKLTINGAGTTLGRGEQAGAIYNDGGNSILTGAIALGSDSTIRSRAGNLTINGVISGSNRALTKTGDGVVTLGANNTYTGATIIEGGALRVSNANQIDGSNLRLNGGVLELAGGLGFTRALGTGTSAVQWTGDGGFSAYGAAATVTLSGGGVTWNGGNFVKTGNALLLGSAYSDNTVTFTNAIALAGTASTLREIRVANGTATTGAATLDATLSGVLSGVAGINKTGSGTLSLTGVNTYTGATVISGGALRVAANSALGSVIIDTPADNKTTNSTQTTSGGTSSGSNTITLSNVASLAVGQAVTGSRIQSGTVITAISGNTITLSKPTSGGFLNSGSTLTFTYASGNTVLKLANTTGLAVGQQITGTNIPAGTTITAISDTTITLSNGLTGALSNNAALNFAAITHGNNLVLNGGVLEIANGFGAFTRSLGDNTSTSAVQWTGDGGFSAYGAAATVNIGNGANLTWGQTYFVGTGNKLLFGSTSANNTVTLANNLALGSSGARTINVTAGATSGIANGILSGVVSGSAGLTVTGNGRLDLTAANTYTGATTLIGSEVRLGGASGSLASPSITVQQGGSLTLDNSAGNNTNRIGDSATVTLNGGTLNFLGASAASSETIGTVTLAGGANTINVQRGGSNSSVLTFAGIDVLDLSSTVNFTNAAGGGTLGGGGSNPGIFIGGVPNDTSSTYGFATVNGNAFATYGANGVVALASTNTGQSSWNSTVHAAPTSNQALSANRTVGSLLLTGGRTVSGAYDLTVQTGGILSYGGSADTISTATLHAGSASPNLYTHVYGSGGLTISSSITNDGGNAKGLVKAGDGTLTLSGSTANTYTGTTTVNDGTLVLNKSTNTTAIAGNLMIGDGSGLDTVRIAANEQIANNATVTLRGGELGNSANVASLVFNDVSGSISETFHTLKVEGNTVLDFAGGNPCAPSFLYLDVLDIAANSLLTIKNWIEFTDFLLVKKTTFDSEDMARIVFDGYGGAASWKDYDSEYYQITPYSPVPEPAAYGVLALGSLGGFALWRRRRVRPAGGLAAR